MRRARLSQFRGGWFLGAFKPSLLPTKQFEVALKRHRHGEDYPAHSQHVATEYNLLVHGRLIVKVEGKREQAFHDGDLFIIPPGEIIKPVFVTDCEVVCVKVPSLPGDRVVLAC